MKDQTIVRLNTCRLLNVGLQRQAIYFLKERSNNCEMKYLSVVKCWFTKTRVGLSIVFRNEPFSWDANSLQDSY